MIPGLHFRIRGLQPVVLRKIETHGTEVTSRKLVRRNDAISTSTFNQRRFPRLRHGRTTVVVSLILSAIPLFSQAEPRLEQQTPGQAALATLNGTVIDRSGASIGGAKVALTQERSPKGMEVLSNENGQFSFVNIAPGPYRLTVSASGFGELTSTGTLQPDETADLPPILMNVAVVVSDVEVRLTREELAQEQLKQQEEQRVLGFLPNFFASYLPDAVPLTSRQKFQLSWKVTLDPMAFALTGMVAGARHAANAYPGYGQEFEGYAKRYGSAYANLFVGTMLSEAVLPSLFKQDPRYFYRGTGSAKSRFFYAVSRTVIRKGDNGEWQPNYSGILGRLAAGGIANLYYPANDRGVGLTFENAALGIGANAFANVMQEFLLKQLTPKVAHVKIPKN